MRCPLCEAADTVERRERTELGYRRFRCRACHREFNERTGTRFKGVESAQRFCRVHDEVRNFLRPRSRRNEVVSLTQRRLLYTAHTHVLLNSLAAA